MLENDVLRTYFRFAWVILLGVQVYLLTRVDINWFLVIILCFPLIGWLFVGLWKKQD